MAFLLPFFVALFAVYPSSATVTLSPSSGNISVCLREVLTLTCVGNASSVGWRNAGGNSIYTTTTNVVAPVGLFTTELVGVVDTIYTASATVNVTSALDGTSLDCIDASSPDTETASFVVIDTSRFSSELSVTPLSSNKIHLTWTDGDCTPRYNVERNGIIINTTSAIQYTDNTVVPGNRYSYRVCALNYTEETVSCTQPEAISFTYDFEIQSAVNETGGNTNLFIVVKATTMDQPPLLSCDLTLNNTSGYNCSQGVNVTRGATHNYTVTVSNIVGSTVFSGFVAIPTPTVCPDLDCLQSPSPSPCPPDPCPLPTWAMIVIIVLVLVLIAVVGWAIASTIVAVKQKKELNQDKEKTNNVYPAKENMDSKL